ncbi:MAG: DUF4906 domain-containing protein, partial [Bacteroidaceae bacterium]|nr:DUF4906 domain-containing protein [Bacteroidaceae bacterium]
IETMEGLKKIPLTWKAGDKIAENNQMFGHFNLSNEINRKASLLTINKRNLSLHAWIRRAASKVTVAYDGTSLEEGVFIYLKSVQIKHIPSTCLLGDTNTIKDVKQLEDGETITYVEDGVPYDEYFPARITKGRPYYPYDKDYKLSKDAHSETANSLFFYENMQGEGKDKTQVKEYLGDNQIYKDGKDYGSYIEVHAYYRSIHTDRVGSGDIIYRFMLGKNVTTDYNAERNYHYKLTLKFNRFANDADWHIEYEEEIPGIQVPEPYYISYLYNHEMEMPVKINMGSYNKIKRFRADIDTNAWAPHDAPLLDYYRKMDPETPEGQANKAPLNVWNGFLSLRKTKTMVIPFPADGDVANANQENKAYYELHNRGNRVYYENGSLIDPNSTEDGEFTMKRDGNICTFNVPMYTRAKQLIIKTGYTGNNPYVAYRRRAVVKFTAVLENENGDTLKVTENADIMQVRRVVNPKGVWRKHDNNKAFHVVLKHLPRESATDFQTFTSEGKWRAYVIRGDKGFVTLDGRDTIKGSTGTPVDFNINFQGFTPANSSRCAIIRVDYHNYTCNHLIFVRQGDAPMQLVADGAKWHARNMRTATEEASCPVEEGSMFRFGNWEQPIDAVNNVNDKPLWINVAESDFKDHASTYFKIAGTTDSVQWSSIKTSNSNGSFSNPTINGKEIRVASYDDYNLLWLSDDIEQGYGVMYGNDATETLSNINEVYGHRYDKHGDATHAGAGYGMRGVFVYNKSETAPYGGRNLFFPIGASGYGRRRDSEAKGTAVLRYGGRTAPISESAADKLKDRPIFYDLYMRPGAIYWLNKRVDNSREKDAIAWDFNYFSFDFNMISVSNVFTKAVTGGYPYSDACFIRCVED